jgi:membrane-associated phospholipid phosphatase
LEQPAQIPATSGIRNVPDRLASAVSVVCSPPLLSVPLTLLAIQDAPPSVDLRPSIAIFLAAVGALPSVFVYCAYRLGYVSSIDLTIRSERLGPAAFATSCAIAAYPLLSAAGGPPTLINLSAALAVQLALLAVITLKWRISYHAASVGGVVLLALVLQGPQLAAPLAALAALVAWSRVRLGCHTPGQVAMGLLSESPVLLWRWVP